MFKKRFLLYILIALLLLGGGVFYYYQSKTKNTPKTLDSEQKDTSSGTEGGKTKQAFVVTELNKSDGSIFSVPDTVSYRIAGADKTKITLKNSAGVILFSGESKK